MSTISFKGTVGGVEYHEPGLFEAAARDLGCRVLGDRKPKWKVGTAVAVTFEDGTKVAGQVWSEASVKNYVWLALDDGRYVVVNLQTKTVSSSLIGRAPIGRIAA